MWHCSNIHKCLAALYYSNVMEITVNGSTRFCEAPLAVADLLRNMALAGGSRWRVEECFEDGKMHLGMADYEARSWSSWHHHMALVALAHLCVTLTKREIKQSVPELTLDLALRVLRSAFARPTLTEDEAMDIIDYHLRRNKVAHDSHRKSWLDRHKRLAKELLL